MLRRLMGENGEDHEELRGDQDGRKIPVELERWNHRRLSPPEIESTADRRWLLSARA